MRPTSRCSIRFRGWILSFVVFGLATLVNSRSFAAASALSDEITILSAIWGVDTRTVDVTKELTELLRTHTGSFAANYTTLPDPAPGKSKRLVITYKYRAAIHTLNMPGGQLSSQKLIDNTLQPETKPAPAASGLQILTEAEMSGIVLIEGDKAVATGFLAKIRGVECVVTNLHVLTENQKFTVKQLDGETVSVSSLSIIGAVGADIALLRLANPTGEASALQWSEDVLKTAKIGAQVVVVGNRLGGGVATQTSGKILGIGPARVEVDAAFQPGNSGSPIYDLASRQVIAVASYQQIITVDMNGKPAIAANRSSSGMKTETRWFGYRIDSVAKWESIDLTKFHAQAQRVTDFHDTSLDLWLVWHGDLVAAAVKNPRLRSLIERLAIRLGGDKADINQVKFSSATVQQLGELMRSVRAYAEEEIKDFGSAEYYDYFRTNLNWAANVPAQMDFRSELGKALKNIEGDLLSYKARLKP